MNEQTPKIDPQVLMAVVAGLAGNMTQTKPAYHMHPVLDDATKAAKVKQGKKDKKAYKLAAKMRRKNQRRG